MPALRLSRPTFHMDRLVRRVPDDVGDVSARPKVERDRAIHGHQRDDKEGARGHIRRGRGIALGPQILATRQIELARHHAIDFRRGRHLDVLVLFAVLTVEVLLEALKALAGLLVAHLPLVGTQLLGILKVQ